MCWSHFHASRTLQVSTKMYSKAGCKKTIYGILLSTSLALLSYSSIINISKHDSNNLELYEGITEKMLQNEEKIAGSLKST